MDRREYYHDLGAPRANSVAPTAVAVVRRGDGRILLVRRADSGNWELPGGRVDVGESAVGAVIREVAEEAGVLVKVTGLAGVYTDPGHVMAYPSGEVRQQFAVCFYAWPLDGEPHPDEHETSAVRWAAADELDGLAMHPTMRLRIAQALTQPDRAHIG